MDARPGFRPVRFPLPCLALSCLPRVLPPPLCDDADGIGGSQPVHLSVAPRKEGCELRVCDGIRLWDGRVGSHGPIAAADTGDSFVRVFVVGLFACLFRCRWWLVFFCPQPAAPELSTSRRLASLLRRTNSKDHFIHRHPFVVLGMMDVRPNTTPPTHPNTTPPSHRTQPYRWTLPRGDRAR